MRKRIAHPFTSLVDERGCAHANLAHHAGSFPNAESAAARALSLPIYPELRELDQDMVCKALASALAMPAAA